MQVVRDLMLDVAVETRRLWGTKKFQPLLNQMNSRVRELIENKIQDAGLSLRKALPPPPKADKPKRSKKKSKASKGARKAASGGEESDDLGETSITHYCQFCGVEDAAFTDETLDLHYWKDCPMLISCPQCDEVIEIHTLNDHILDECEVPGTHSMCARCKEPVPVKELKVHKANAACLPRKPASKKNRCPLCHQDTPPGEEGIKAHLLERGGCPKNPRKVLKKK